MKNEDKKPEIAARGERSEGMGPEGPPLLLQLLPVGIVLVLVTWQWWSRSALWVDEIATVRNALELTWQELLSGRQAYEQYAPPGFLLAVKGVAAALGDGDRQLRLLPALAAVMSVILCLRIARSVFPQGWWSLTPPLLLAAMPPLVHYGGEAKPYVLELLLTLALLWTALPPLRGRQGSLLPSFWLGLISPWLALGAVFQLASSAGLRVVEAVRCLSLRRRMLVFLGVGICGVGAVALLFLLRGGMSEEGSVYLSAYWREGLPERESGFAGRLVWAWQALAEHQAYLFGLEGVGGSILAVASLLGLGLLARRDPRFGAVVAGPLALMLIAGMMRLYPFSGRLGFPAAPALILGLTEVLAWSARRLWRAGGGLAPRALPVGIGIVAGVVGFAAPPLGVSEDLPSLLTWVAEEKRPDDRVYVYYGAWQSFCFYGEDLDLVDDSAVIGGCHRRAPEGYEEELRSFCGTSRLWVLETHGKPGREWALLPELLDREGNLIDGRVLRSGDSDNPEASVYLYDLSEGPCGASRQDSPVGPEKRLPTLDCRRGPHVPPSPMMPASEACRH